MAANEADHADRTGACSCSGHTILAADMKLYPITAGRMCDMGAVNKDRAVRNDVESE